MLLPPPPGATAQWAEQERRVPTSAPVCSWVLMAGAVWVSLVGGSAFFSVGLEGARGEVGFCDCEVVGVWTVVCQVGL